MMVQRFVVVLLIMVVWVGCGKDEFGKPGEKKVPLQNSKKITKDSPKKITWDKDGAEMVLIPEGFRETEGCFLHGYDGSHRRSIQEVFEVVWL